MNFFNRPPRKIVEPTTELEFNEYYHAASARASQIVQSIIEGHRPMMNDLNLLSELDTDILNPPVDWAHRIADSLQSWVDGVKSQFTESGNDIAFYILRFSVRQAGMRATVRFSFTAPLKR